MRNTLSQICVYPVKALGGYEVERCLATGLGLDGDRRWVLTDPQGKFISQRSHPRLALVRVATLGNKLELSAPEADNIFLSPPQNNPRTTVTVWDDTINAVAGPEQATDWFSRFLGLKCQLHYMDKDSFRPVAMPEDQPGQHQVSFADGFPCLLASSASLDLLNSKLPEPVPMDRFRANLVVTGCEPHAEDGWGRFRIGEAVFRMVKPCSRCKVPTIDQATGENSADGEPLRTLATYRAQPGGIMFGANLVVEEAGNITVGDEVHFLE